MKMIMFLRSKRLFVGVLTFIAISISTNAQDNPVLNRDTLTLENVISIVMENNPIVKQSGEFINSAELAVRLARSGYLPTLNANGTYSRMDPIPAFDIPNLGHIQTYPDNSIGLNVELYQLVYDFGKTSKAVSLQETNKELSELSADQLKQRFALASSNLFFNLYYLQTAKDIVNEHLETLKKHLKFVQNKQKTGSATQYEILTTQVRVSTAQTQLSEIQSNYEIQLSRLCTLMGTDIKQAVFLADTNINQNSELKDSSFIFALTHRDDLLILEKKKDAATINYKLNQSQYLPTVGIFGTGGWKNGYLDKNNVEQLRANYILGISLKVPLFDGSRKNIKLKLAESSINQNNYEIENSTRVAMNEISETYSQLQVSETKIGQSKVQVQQAMEAYSQAELNFKEGVITNLDLIYAADILSDSKLQLLKNQMEYQNNLIKFRFALGITIYQ